jgi:hypothetical protein
MIHLIADTASKTGQQKIGQYFKADEKRDTDRANTSDQSTKVS